MIGMVDHKASRPRCPLWFPSLYVQLKHQLDVLFRDPDNFVAREIHRHVGEWSKILDSSSKKQEIMHYIRHKVTFINLSKAPFMILLPLQGWLSPTVILVSRLSDSSLILLPSV